MLQSSASGDDGRRILIFDFRTAACKREHLCSRLIELGNDFIRTSIHDEYDLMLSWHVFCLS